MATCPIWSLRTFAFITVMIKVKSFRNVLVRTFSIASDRIPSSNALSTLLTNLGGESGIARSRVSNKVIKALSVCLSLSLPSSLPPSHSPSLFFLSSLLCYLHDQTTSILMVTRWLSAALSLHSSRKKSPRKALLPSMSSKNPEPSLRLSLSCLPIHEAIMAAKQVEYSD